MVTQASHDRLEGVVVVVHLLQTQNVRTVGEDLLQDQVLSFLPVEGIKWTTNEPVLPFTESWETRDMDFNVT